MSIFYYVLVFLFTLGILITFHEFGHFWVARRCGVLVERFSIGFGRPLWTRRFGRDQTEFVIAAIPFGGYIKMLGEQNDSSTALPSPRSFQAQPLWRRSAIIMAGPLFNLLLGVLVYWVIFMIGVSGLKPIVGDITPDSVAASAGFQPGDELLSVGTVSTTTWAMVNEAVVMAKVAKELQLPIMVHSDSGFSQRRDLDLRTIHLDHLGKDGLFVILGMTARAPHIEPIIRHLEAGGAASIAGLRLDDRVLSVSGRAISDWQQLVSTVRENPEVTLNFKVLRGSDELDLAVTPGKKINKKEEKIFGYIGAAGKIDKTAFTRESYTLLPAFVKAVERTIDFSVLTVRMIWQIATGQASIKNLSGPVSIAEYAGKSADAGLVAFLQLLGVFTISLGIINLIPLPPLDGGMLLGHFIEAVAGPAAFRWVMHWGQYVGAFFLLFVMLVATYNDLLRLFSG